MENENKLLSHIANSIKPGIYKHFKGGEYKVLGVGRMSEDRTQEVVIYQSIETGALWVRPLIMFVENVERDGYNGPRFTFIEKNED